MGGGAGGAGGGSGAFDDAGVDAGDGCEPELDLCGDGFDQDCDGIADDECNVVFVTSIALPIGALGEDPLGAADDACEARADAAGLNGKFLAYLSTSSVDARDRLGSARGFVRVDGKPVADTADDLAEGHLLHPVVLDELGDVVNASVATGSSATGTAHETCGDYAKTEGNVSTGSPFGGGGMWQFAGLSSCASSYRIYCVGYSHETPLASLPIPEGHLAFVSSAPFESGEGIELADKLCAEDAASAGLSGTFVALLATTSAAAISRITDDGAPVVRTDGVVVAPTTSAFAGFGWEAPLNVLAAGGGWLGNVSVWTGAESPTAGDPKTCSDYESQNPDDGAFRWRAGLPWNAAAAGTVACNATTARVYCVEP